MQLCRERDTLRRTNNASIALRLVRLGGLYRTIVNSVLAVFFLSIHTYVSMIVEVEPWMLNAAIYPPPALVVVPIQQVMIRVFGFSKQARTSIVADFLLETEVGIIYFKVS